MAELKFSYFRTLKEKYFESEIFGYVVYISISIILGLVAGFGGILFYLLLEAMRLFFHPDNFIRVLRVGPGFIVIIPIVGAIVTSALTRFFPRQAAEKGVISVIKAVILNYGYIPLKNTIFHLFAPIISIGTGAPLGPEGPAAKIGSGMGSFMSQVLNLNRNDMMMYTAAGAGAAISAVFNAPIAGVFFGIEVILQNDLKNRALSALVISSVVADMLSTSVIGGHGVFSIPGYDIGGVEAFPFYMGLAVACGILCIGYFKLKNYIGWFVEDYLKIKNHYLKLVPAAFIFGLSLLFYNQLFGIGYELASSAINGILPVRDLIILLVLKVFFLALFIKCGAYGGTFAPSLVIGALAGGLFAETAAFLTGVELNTTAFALVGMGGVLAGLNSIPLTSMMLVFEVTGDYQFILPLMLVAVISYLVTVYYNKGSVYTAELLKEGIDLTRKGEADLLGKVRAGRIMRIDFDTVSHRAGFDEIIKRIMRSRYGDLFVLDDTKSLVGVISLNKVKEAMNSSDLAEILIAADIADPVDAVHENDPVSIALQKMEIYDIDTLPVLGSFNRSEIAGIITHQDIIVSYNSLLRQVEASQELVNFRREKGERG